MGDADSLRLLADSTAIASFIPALADVLHAAANVMEEQDRLILAQGALIEQLEAAAKDNG